MRTGLFYPLMVLFLFSGCQNKYYTEADFHNVTKVDAHAHLNSNNTFFEEQARKDNFILITINVDHAGLSAVKEQLGYALNAVRKFPDEVFYSATFCFDTTGWDDKDWSDRMIDQIRENISGGAVSVKLWKNIGMAVTDRNGKFIMVDDPKMDPVIEYVISRNLPVTGHLGEPRNCWLPLTEMTVRSDSGYFAHNPQYHMFLHPEYPTYEDQINARDNMLSKHPDLRFIGCHLGSLEWDVDELALRLDKFPNMAVDLAARICHLQYQSKTSRNKIRDFCIRYQDRIIYGTDLSDNGKRDSSQLCENIHNTWIEDWLYFATRDKMKSDTFNGSFDGLQLPKEVVNKIFGENAIKWYKLALK
jgi:predicted TIM-barrel fold metal-dependent hydrolase